MRVLLLILLSLAQPGGAVEFVRAPYLQLATDNSLHVVWRTNGAGNYQLRFGQSPDRLFRLVPDHHLIVRNTGSEGALALHADTPAQVHQYEAFIDGLQPNTTYYYGIFENGRRLTPAEPSYRFQTHPVPGEKADAYFWVVGDSGTGTEPQAQVHQAMVTHNAQHGKQLDFYLHVGDMAYRKGTTTEFNDRFFKVYEPTLRNTVCWAAMGNHEGLSSRGETGTGPFYDAFISPRQAEAGGLPSGNESYYSFDYGRAHFICLNSHDLDRRPSGAMAKWLKADLEKTQADFLIAYFHHPAYTKGSHDSDVEKQHIEMRELIMPILESGGVDLVFGGHSHIYERSMLMDGAYQTPTTAVGVIFDDGDGDPAGDGAYRKSAGLQPRNGTVQVVAGHGGARLSRKGTMPVMKRIILEHGSVLVSLSGDTLTGQMLNSQGQLRDTFAITKRGHVRHKPLSDPWQPASWKPDPGPSVSADPSTRGVPIVRKNSEFAYLLGQHPAGEDLAWTRPGYDASSWPRGTAGFGYGDKDDVTHLAMKGKSTVLYLRKEFTIPERVRRLILEISYDDAFIAYLNGQEVLRVGVREGRGASAKGITAHEAGVTFSRFPLKRLGKLLKPGALNVLAIEGHNVSLDSSDFSLHPVLLQAK